MLMSFMSGIKCVYIGKRESKTLAFFTRLAGSLLGTSNFLLAHSTPSEVAFSRFSDFIAYQILPILIQHFFMFFLAKLILSKPYGPKLV